MREMADEFYQSALYTYMYEIEEACILHIFMEFKKMKISKSISWGWERKEIDSRTEEHSN